MLRRHKHWWPVVAWMAFIFLMSTGLGTSDHTSRFIEPILRWLLPHAGDDTIARWHGFLRKLGHFSEYAVLALLIQRALGITLGPGARAWRVALLALALSAGYAATDEFHQVFVPGRTPSPVDVGIDSTGAVAALIGGGVMTRRRSELIG